MSRTRPRHRRGPGAALPAFAAAERGSMTMEFVLWVPLLGFWLVASLVIYDAYDTRSRASKAAYTISDILSRKSVLDRATLAELDLLQDRLLPGAGSARGLRVSNIRCIAADPGAGPALPCRHAVVWSLRRQGGTGGQDFEVIEAADPATLPLGLLPPMTDREELLLVELTVPFRPLSDWAGIEARTWEVGVVTRARYVTGLALAQDLRGGG